MSRIPPTHGSNGDANGESSGHDANSVIERRPDQIRNGPIAWMARNTVAANLVMFFLLVGGVGMFFAMQKEVQPDAALPVVNVRVQYPGASPAEVERGILLPVEEAVRGLEVVKEVRSTARENSGTVEVELVAGTDRGRGLQRINQAVDTIQTFPAEAEEPEVSLAVQRRDVLEVRLFGDADLYTLRQVAQRVRDQLVRHEDVTQVELEFDPALITHVEVPQRVLREHQLTLQDVADRIAEASEDVPGGRLETDGGKLAVRVRERKQYAREFAEIPIITSDTGQSILLGDIAQVRDGFEETLFYSQFSGQPAMELGVFRVGDQSPLAVAEAVEQTMRQIESQLPAGIEWAITDNRADDYRQRLSLLGYNGLMGLALVLLVLGVFLQYRLAMWVTVGMLTAFTGSLLFLPAVDVSINMISMFAFLIALGIVVDDAIVVGENIYEYRQGGMPPLAAAIRGARDMARPVTFGVITTCVAFVPLMFIPGELGMVWKVVPLVVITVLLLPLVEAMFVLPAHLAHARVHGSTRLGRFVERRQQAFADLFSRKTRDWLTPTLDACLRQRYLTIAVSLALLLVVVGYALSDRMGKVLMPQVPTQEFAASAQMPSDVTDAKAREVTRQLTDAAVAVIAENGGPKLAEGVKSNIYGTTVSVDVVMAADADAWPITLEEFERQWRQRAGPVPSAESLTFEMEGGFGFWRPDVTVELSHPQTQTLDRASAALVERLEAFEVTSDVNDSYQRGSARLDFVLNERGVALGLTPEIIGRQVRNAFQGAEARRFLRGPDEVRVRVKLPDNEQRSVYDIENLMIRPPGGGEVPLAEVASVEVGETFQEINRRQGRRVVTVESDVNPKSQITRVLNELETGVLPALTSDFPGLTWSFQGRQEQMRQSLNSLFVGLLLALMAIYAMLAIPFRSYVQPAIVLMAIPFGAFGAVIGHWLLGYNLSVLSLMGIVGLCGVLVNDSLIMVDTANQLRSRHEPLQAIKLAGVRRFRPILLTTLTTFGGLAPIILEESRQAQFLIPMAISLGFGILFASAITVIVVPCFYMMVEDVKAVFGKHDAAEDAPADDARPAGRATVPART